MGGELEIRDGLGWDRDALVAFGWLVPLLDVPDDAMPPLFMTGPHPDARWSYGAEANAWMESELGITLRWWQRLVNVRQLEHREDGSLCWHTIVESGPRRSGKSVRVKGMALWRMEHADLFGERQEVVHTGSDLAVCRKVQKGTWAWARQRGLTVMQANGKESIETPAGDTWLVRAQNATYGWDTTLGIVDEGWDVKPETVSEGLEPSLLERVWPQLHLTSTAHRRATSLMRQRIRDALTTDDGETLLMLWGAGVNEVDDPGDPEVWRAASPHWSEERHRMIATKYAAAVAGEADPQLDDPNPMQGFLAQYLNVWQLHSKPAEKGEAVIAEDEWGALVATVPAGPPDGAAVEAWFGDGASLALAWRTEDDMVVISVRDLPDLSPVAGMLRTAGYRRQVVVGTSLLKDPALARVRTRGGQGRAGAAVAELRRLLTEDALRHDGGDHLSVQVLAARTMPGVDGPRLVSTAGADAVKAAVWAATEARRARRKPLVVVSSR